MGTINLTDTELEQLLSATCSRTVRTAEVRRAKLILMFEDGESRDSVIRTPGCDSRFIACWSGRFLGERLAGMYARHPGRNAQASGRQTGKREYSTVARGRAW
ncbi:hypothetical protein [Caballeronia calidae]|uniref:hypothetical protein n=1 Tax=Caballeronia calidae TaxID=1777139 RepID=UPI000AB5B0C0|nr:hypothetical protein [Caballeronia calidae]